MGTVCCGQKVRKKAIDFCFERNATKLCYQLCRPIKAFIAFNCKQQAEGHKNSFPFILPKNMLRQNIFRFNPAEMRFQKLASGVFNSNI
jgi:hypothetical protein